MPPEHHSCGAPEGKYIENTMNVSYCDPKNDERFDPNALYAALDEHRRYPEIT